MTKAIEFNQLFERWAQEHFKQSSQQNNFVELLFQSQKYAVHSGGKRFRPYLASLVYQVFNSDLTALKNFCLAIEMIHTYSLIHDDLPCMDNDDFRRGKPTTHKVYGEDIALLTGDGLLTDAFHLIAKDKRLLPDVCVAVMAMLSEKIGSLGMVGGQVLDMQAKPPIGLKQLQQIHIMKTGFLIQAAAVGAAMIAQAPQATIEKFVEFSFHLGLAFQIKDDLLDSENDSQAFKNYISVIGLEKTKEELNRNSEEALKVLASIDDSTGCSTEFILELQNLIKLNQTRTI